MRGLSMRNKDIEILFKILVVLGWIFFALLFIYPIFEGIIGNNDSDGIEFRFKIILCLLITDGLLLSILMCFGSKFLTKSKINRHIIAYSDIDELMSGLQEKLYAEGYIFDKTIDSKLDSIWIYKKSRHIHNDYFIIINFAHIPSNEQTYDLQDILDLTGIKNVHYGFFIFCCNNLKSKTANAIFNLSKEGINRGYLTAVVELKKATLSYKKITDGFAHKRQHKKIDTLLSFFSHTC